MCKSHITVVFELAKLKSHVNVSFQPLCTGLEAMIAVCEPAAFAYQHAVAYQDPERRTKKKHKKQINP